MNIIDESKICNSASQNCVDESDIKSVDEFLKGNRQQNSINVVTTGISKNEFTDRQIGATKIEDQIPTKDTINSNNSTFKRATQEIRPLEVDSIYKPTYGVAMMNVDMTEFKYDKLIAVLRKYHEYPEKYRTIIWRQLLDLPLRKIEFESYILKESHPAFSDAYKRVSTKSPALYNKVVRM